MILRHTISINSAGIKHRVKDTISMSNGLVILGYYRKSKTIWPH
jgi:hypothetical protein